MKRILYVICVLLMSASYVSAQTTYASKKEVKEYETAVLLMGDGKYTEALPKLQALVRGNKEFVDAAWTLAELYGYMNNEAKMLQTLEGVAKPKLPRYYNSLMRLAKAYHNTCNYEKAIATYELVPQKEMTYYKMAQKAIAQCKDGIELASSPIPFQAKNMGPNINTQYDDYWPSITADESLFSTTVNIGKLEGQSTVGKGVHEDIFISKKQSGSWGKIQNAGQSLNSIGNEGAQCFSLDGRYLFFIACDRQQGMGGCDIYYSIREGDGWSRAINPGAPLNSKHWETYPSLSPTGDELYFASTRPGGVGKSDIWKCKVKIKDDGMLEFSEPVNMGAPINTADDEQSPFIHADNHTLFFSSKGHKGLGKMDIFVSYKDENGKWSQPKNMGYPLNTCRDEIGFVVNANGDKAFYSSDGQEKNGKGREVYEIDMAKNPLKPMKKMKYSRGKIVDEATGKPIQTKINVYSTKTNEKVFTSVSDRTTGEFVTCVPEGEETGLNVNKRGYMLISEHFDNDKMVKLDDKKGMALEKIEVGKKITLKNIFYDFDKSTLKTASYNELDNLIQFLKTNPTVKIRLCGHTDSKGNAEYNKKLSDTRAKTAYDYLVKKGINASRLEYKGYGAEQPIADNKTDEGRALNRRTEFLIIGK